MKPGLKLNNISNLHDARYCSAVGIQLLAFNFRRGDSGSLEAEEVAAMMEWLSGPQSVAEFDLLDVARIEAIIERCQLDFVSLPLDIDPGPIVNRDAGLIFRAPIGVSFHEIEGQLRAIHVRYPEALFEIDTPMDDSQWEALRNAKLMPQMILRAEKPDNIYAMLQKSGPLPFAFSLGDFVAEPDGLIDYEQCDDFIAEFQTLVPA